MSSSEAKFRNRKPRSGWSPEHPANSGEMASAVAGAADLALDAGGKVKKSLLALADVRECSVDSSNASESNNIDMRHRSLAEWLHENEFIQTGYRAPSNSVDKSVRSIWAIHNETSKIVNIWSHIIGCVIFLAIPVYIFTTEIPPRYQVATREDIVVCTAYFLGVATCFFLSATYHTLSNHSSQVHFFSVQLDFLGILILMYTAMIPLIYYGFVCDHDLRNRYWALVSVLAALCAVSTMHPRFHTAKARTLRGLFYTAFGASSFAPIVHAVSRYGWEVQRDRMGLVWWAYVAFFNCIGVVAYGLKIPERYFPGRFDIVGQSHHVLHVSVTVAGLMHVMGCLSDFDYLHEHGAQCS